MYLGDFCTTVPLLGCGIARPSESSASELKVLKSDIGKRGYHALEVAVVEGSVFLEGAGACLGLINAWGPRSKKT